MLSSDAVVSLLVWCALAATPLSGQGPPNPPAAGTVLVLVVRDTAGAPVVHAEVAVVGRPTVDRADAAGRVRVAGAPPLILVVRAVGYFPDTLRFVAGEPLVEQTVVLRRNTVQLPEIEVEGRASIVPEKYRRIIRMEGFFQRMHRRMGGVFITPDQVDASVAGSVERLLAERAIPGVRNGWWVAGCPGDKIGIWVDGMKVGRDGLKLHPRDVEAVELYRRAIQIPAEYLDDSCAAILIWTAVP